MRATSISSEEGAPAAVADAAAADPWRASAIDMEFPLQSRPAQSSRQGKIGSLIYFSRGPGTISKVPSDFFEPFPAGARLMVKWRVGRLPDPPRSSPAVRKKAENDQL